MKSCIFFIFLNHIHIVLHFCFKLNAPLIISTTQFLLVQNKLVIRILDLKTKNKEEINALF
jgi:hypothetical protein